MSENGRKGLVSHLRRVLGPGDVLSANKKGEQTREAVGPLT